VSDQKLRLGPVIERDPAPARRLADEIRAAVREYAEEVRQGRFPAAERTYSAPPRSNGWTGRGQTRPFSEGWS
jgi:plasmid stabilization system protein ParE